MANRRVIRIGPEFSKLLEDIRKKDKIRLTDTQATDKIAINYRRLRESLLGAGKDEGGGWL